MKTWQTELCSKLQQARPSLTSINFVTGAYDGLLRGEDYFISVTPETNVHPLYDYMQDNEYLRRVSSGFKMQVITDTEDKLTLTGKANLNINDPSALQTLVPADHPTQDFTMGDLVIREGHAAASDWTSPVIEMDANGCRMQFWVGMEGNWQLTQEGKVEMRPLNITPNVGIWCAYPDPTQPGLWKESRNFLNKVGALRAEAVKAMGCYVYYNTTLNQDSNAQQFTDIKLPVVLGCRRWFYFYATANGVVGVGGYLLGEGEDCYYANFSYHTPANAWRRAQRGEINALVKRTTSVSAADVKKVPYIDVMTLWPLSWNTEVLHEIGGEVVFEAEVEEESLMNTRLYSQTFKFTVAKGYGRLDKASYMSYLANGYELFPPLDAAQLEKAQKSWELIPTSVSFALATQKCNGRSMKELPFYSEYGKKRAKACKDNNFMELPYNDEFTNKQIENKLSALTSLSVWARDSALSSQIGNDGAVDTTTVERVTTIVKIDDKSFTYTVNNASHAGTIVMSDVTIEAWLETILPSRFAGDFAMIDSFLAASGENSLAAANEAMTATKLSRFNLNMSAYGFGASVSYEDVCANLPVTAQIGFLASQVSDFRHFNVQVPLLIRSLMGSSTYPLAAEKFVFDVV